ncbi:class IIb bacteriocin, lactobin A/cerein 7B family [Psychrosphaera sp. F3M07]|nr:class IIb bacteriocin, lactobin A/cerein 7B family [Psychrosphaera sp. F3M07]MBU2917026.1 class IIb bacteriocin, lactobin A/cerein 7B family [Psychrosphaera sp. F3M07]
MRELSVNEVEQVNGGLADLAIVGIVALVAMILAYKK